MLPPRGIFTPPSLPEQALEKHRVVEKIAFPETAWLLGQPVEPGQAHVLHPGRSITLCPGIDIKGESYRQQGASPQPAPKTVNPFLLARGSKAHPDEVGL